MAALSVIIVVSGSVWYRQYASNGQSGPSVGGTYVEGIIGGRDHLEVVAAKLTKAGLFSLNSSGGVENLLIDSYQANTDQTSFDFTLKKGISADEISADLERNIGILGEASTRVDGQHLIVDMATPNPNLPLLLTQPLFDFGPYKLSSITDKTAIFTRNTKENALKTYINRIVVHAYADQNTLDQALKRQKIDGAVASDASSASPKGYQIESYELTRCYDLVLNTNVSPFRNVDERKKLLAGTPGSIKSFTLVVPDEEPYLTLANQQITAWQSIGVTVQVEKKPTEDFTNIMLGRSFQAVITGVDYGTELDPYYVWDSTQIRPPGNNVSGMRSTTVDTFIARIRASNSLVERRNMLESLDALVLDEGAAKELQDAKGNMFIAKGVNFVAPFSALTPDDHWQTIHLWSID